MKVFLYHMEQDRPDENDDVIGCEVQDRICICTLCGKEDCIFRGSMRCEVV